VAEQVVNCCKGAEVTTALNAPAINPELLKQMQPSLKLAETLGRFVVQLCDSPVRKLEVSVSGTLLEYPTQPIMLSVLKGFLEPITDQPVNFVNARIIVESKGIEVVETRSATPKDYLQLKTVSATMENGQTVSISGTVFAPNRPRVVSINNLHFEMRAQGNVTLVENDDVPGIIGLVGTTLGNAGINIGEISWGRDKQGGKAMTVILTDGVVPDEVFHQLAALPHVLSVRRVAL
jgi:D-3-phosphoglycerate dehydrogenase